MNEHLPMDSNGSKRYMNLLVDYAFKRLFGQPQGADLLVAFLNAVLQREGAQRIVQVEFHNTEFPSKDAQDKTVRLDVLARTNTDEWIDVEVQVAPQKTLAKRSLLYWARVYDGQTERGKDYDILRPTIVIQILDFVFVHSTERFHTSYQCALFRYNARRQRLTKTDSSDTLLNCISQTGISIDTPAMGMIAVKP